MIEELRDNAETRRTVPDDTRLVSGVSSDPKSSEPHTSPEGLSEKTGAVAWLRMGPEGDTVGFVTCDEDDDGAFPVYAHPLVPIGEEIGIRKKSPAESDQNTEHQHSRLSEPTEAQIAQFVEKHKQQIFAMQADWVTADSDAREEISDAWETLEGFGFPPEACGWPHQSIVGELPNAIRCALDCIIRQREALLQEIIPLRKLSARPVEGGAPSLRESSEKFIADFVAKQQPLGADFAKVLNDNLWDLYMKDDAETRRSDPGECQPPAGFAEPNLPTGMVMVPREALEAATRAANLALFVIRKQDVMPNSSWENGPSTKETKNAQ